MTADPSSSRDGWLLGVDIGTSSVKALAVGLAGRHLAYANVEHPMHRARPGWAENDPEDWVTGVCRAVAGLVEFDGVDPSAALGMWERPRWSRAR